MLRSLRLRRVKILSMKTSLQSRIQSRIQSMNPTDIAEHRVYAALDLHSARSVLGSMGRGGEWLGLCRFATGAEELAAAVGALGADVSLTLEAGPLTRWAAAARAGLMRTKPLNFPRSFAPE